LEEKRIIAKDVINSLGIAQSVRSTFIEETDSPWNEKALIKRKKGLLDVKLTIWKDTLFLYGRIYHLFLYIYDVLNPNFQYDPKITPDEDREPKIRDRYNQIWSLYVDSRIEKIGIENFYDKALRKNLFIDIEKELSWEEADAIFQKLWEKDSYTYPEIIDYAYNLNKLREKTGITNHKAFEIEMNEFLRESYVKKHIDKLSSNTFRDIVNELLNFAAYHCKDAHIESSYYGISFIYQRRVFAEMISTRNNLLFLTLLDAQSNLHETYKITEGSDIGAIQKTIKDMYNKISLPSHF